jgi:hypothetical protein
MNFSCAEMNMQKIPSAVVHLIVALIYIWTYKLTSKLKYLV